MYPGSDNGRWTETGEADWFFERGSTSDNRRGARRACFHYGRVVAHPVRPFPGDDDPQTPRQAPHRRRYEALHTQALLRGVQIHGGHGETTNPSSTPARC
jgi:hypothetical protein